MAPVLENMRDVVYDKILEKIMGGVYPSGSRLVFRKLAAELDVSITPVREALNSLAKDGIIDLVPQLGYFIKEFDVDDMMKLLEARALIEPYTTRLAAQNISDKHISILRTINMELKEAAGNDNLVKVNQKEQEFHSTIADLSGNEYLASIVKNYKIMELCSRYTHLAKEKMSDAEYETYLYEIKVSRRHDEIIDALSKHNGEEVEHIMRAHFSDKKRKFSKLVEKNFH